VKLDCLKLVELPLHVDRMHAGEVLVRVDVMSLDPYMRQAMAPRAYGIENPLGSVMKGGAVGTVLVSHAVGLQVGDVVMGGFGWREYSIVPVTMLQKVCLVCITPLVTIEFTTCSSFIFDQFLWI
jgi:NADPH-dependent curcumin reductase CurA